MGLGALFGGG